MQREREAVLDALGAMAACGFVHERPGAEGLARSDLGGRAFVRREPYSALDDEIQRVRRVVGAIDHVARRDVDFARDLRESQQVPRTHVLEEIGALEDQHAFHGAQHGVASAVIARPGTDIAASSARTMRL